MAKPLMSDAEIKRRKRVQGHISQTTGTLGLAALGGTMVASRTGRNTLRKIPQAKRVLKAPPPKDPNRDRIKGGLTPLLATSAGLGGLGAFNFASYTNAESRKRKQATPVAKRETDMDVGYFGEEGHPLLPAEIETEVAKAWSPSASNFDSESSRKKRNSVYQGGALVGGGASAAYAGHHGAKTVSAAHKLKPSTVTEVKGNPEKMAPVNSAGNPLKSKLTDAVRSTNLKSAKAYKPGALKAVKRPAGKTALGVAGVGTAVAAGTAIHRKRQGSWEPYAKGLTMDDIEKGLSTSNGQHRETGN